MLIESDGIESIRFDATAAEEWDRDLLVAAEDLLRGRIKQMPESPLPVQVTLVGSHHHADGTCGAPAAEKLAYRQIRTLLTTVGAV